MRPVSFLGLMVATHTQQSMKRMKGDVVRCPAAHNNATSKVKVVVRIKPPTRQNIPRLPAQHYTSMDDASGSSPGSRAERRACRPAGGTWRSVRSVGSRSHTDDRSGGAT